MSRLQMTRVWRLHWESSYCEIGNAADLQAGALP